MKIKKINPPNYGFLDVTLEKNHTDFLYSLIEKYEPKESSQQWMLVDDNNRFQKEVLNEAIKEYLKDIGYYFSEVETIVENLDNNLVNIIHKIDLGSKAKIKKISFLDDASRVLESKGYYKRYNDQQMEKVVHGRRRYREKLDK